MAAYPVRGLDINSSFTIYNLLNEQKERGTAVIFVGEDLDVLLALCDRILVIGSGEVTALVDEGQRDLQTDAILETINMVDNFIELLPRFIRVGTAHYDAFLDAPCLTEMAMTYDFVFETVILNLKLHLW